MKKNRVLFIIQLPPPVHGMSLINQHVYENPALNNVFEIDLCQISFTKTNNEIGTLSALKIFRAFTFFIPLIWKISTTKYHQIYFTPTPYGFAFLRDICILFLLKLSRQKVSLHWHGKGVKSFINKFPVCKFMFTWLFSKMNMICLSQELISDLEPLVNPKRVFVIPNGIECSHALKTITTQYDFLFFSNIKYEKGILIFLEALRILKKKGVKFRAAIAGNSSKSISKRQLENLIEKYELTDCAFYLGAKFGSEKANLFLSSRLFIFPTQFEAFGLVAIEAMAYGLPVIASDEGSLKSIVEPHGGYIIKKDDSTSFAEKMEDLLHDPEKCSTMGEYNQNKYSEKYRLEIFQEAIFSYFTSLKN